jgi:pyruvate formate lyase activating enzyme
MREALFYTTHDDRQVRCCLCPHACRIPDGATGRCGVRRNVNGTLMSLVYGKTVAEHIDPIEKKPLFHVLPGTRSYSIATVGCNLSCRHCQNASISRMPADRGRIAGQDRSPQAIVDAALDAGCASIAFTYTEPTVYFEYALDIAVLAHRAGLATALISNGYISSEPLRMLAPHLDCANIDLKAFRDDFYREVCGARLEPVLQSLQLYKRLGVWVEVTTLIIPGYNDTPGELRECARFIMDLGPETPWHVTAFYPCYRLDDAPPTGAVTLARAREIGIDAGLRHVYTGNVACGEGEWTLCHACGCCVIRRAGFRVAANNLRGGACPDCGAGIAGIWTRQAAAADGGSGTAPP